MVLSSSVRMVDEMNCRPEVSNELRSSVVERINFYRQMLAFGMAPNREGWLPGAKNMYRIWYDCSLEDRAYQFTSTCGNGGAWPSNAVAVSGMSSAPIPASSAPGSLLTLMNGHIKLAQTNGLAADVKVTAAVANWAHYATGSRTRVGCSYRMDCNTTSPSFPYGYYLACVFDTSAAATGDAAYQVGDKCVIDSDCTSFVGSTCDAATGLCQYKYTDSGANTQCPGTPASLTDAQRNLVLQWHNQLRSSLAKGNEPDGAGGNAPPAKRMTKMTYSCVAEKTAHEWGAQCNYDHSTNRNNTGENLYMSSDNVQDPAAALTAASQLWWKELVQYGVGPDVNLTDAVWERGVGHYTQMAWQETTQVGCGWIHCPTFTYVVCQYKPAGNYMYKLIYEPGSACQTNADCGSGRTCIVAEGLCQV
ncbi:unnamed protein product, partial [Mesorhabditis spiculigera]